jgi:hypothetical protein
MVILVRGHGARQRHDEPVAGLVLGGGVGGVDDAGKGQLLHAVLEVRQRVVHVEGKGPAQLDGHLGAVEVGAREVQAGVPHGGLAEPAEHVVATGLGAGRVLHPLDQLGPGDLSCGPVAAVPLRRSGDVEDVVVGNVVHSGDSRWSMIASWMLFLPCSASLIAGSTVLGDSRWWMTTGCFCP